VRRVVWGFALVLLFLVATAVVGVSCSSLTKAKLERELLALDKNEPVASLGLERVRLPVRLAVGDSVETREREFVYVHVPAREDAGRAPLVLVHGTPGSLFGWSEAALGDPDVEALRPLAADRDVWLLDVAGHGVTPKLPGKTTFQRGADWIGAFLDGLSLEDVTLVGHSYGGEFAWRAALDHPDRIARLVLVDSAGAPRRDDEWLPEEEAMRELSLAPYGYVLNSRSRVASALQPHFDEPLEDDRLTEMTRILDNASNWRATVELARDENGSRVEDLRQLTQSTLLLWGADDHAYPPERFAQEFLERVPDATLVALPGLGHYPHEEDPAAFNAALTAWLVGQGAPASSD